MKKAINLVDVLISLTVISVIFSLTLPVLNYKAMEREVLIGFNNFNDTLQSAITQWKTEINCPYKAGMCIKLQQKYNSVNPDFKQLEPYLKLYGKIDKKTQDISLLPFKTLDYSGKYRSTYNFRTNEKRDVYMLINGVVFSVLTDNSGYWIIVDVNGKRPPNRIGKDTFHLTVGYNTESDINYYSKSRTTDGLCGILAGNRSIKCDPSNINPKIGNGASPTAYLVAFNKLPDFNLLSRQIDDFKP